jgi:hypothetical protein
VPGVLVSIGIPGRRKASLTILHLPDGGKGPAPRQRARSEAARTVLLSDLAAHPDTGRLRIINTPVGQELIAELNSFEVDFTSAGNMRVDVRSKDHHGDLVIATSLALWSAVGRPSGSIEVGQLENWY